MANGVEAECFMERVHPARARRLLFVGQWLPAKGIRDLVEAFTAMAGARPTWSWRAWAPARRKRPCSATFPSACGPGSGCGLAWSAMRSTPSSRRADLFVFPSLSEGFSNALLEAMAASLPIVATPAGAAADLLRDGINAAVVPACDSAALAAGVEALLGDGTRRARLARAAHATARDYEMGRVNERFIERLMHVMEWRPAPVASAWPGRSHVEG